jgi:hypothetical protein
MAGKKLSDLAIVTGDTGDLVYLVKGGNSRAAKFGNLLSFAQPLDTGLSLTEIADLETAAGNFIVGNGDTGAGWETQTAAQVRQTLSLDTGSSPQFASIHLGHPTDTDLTRSDSGVVAVNGKDLAFAEPKGSAKTGQFYSLVLSDRGGIVAMDTGEAAEVAIPPNSSVAFPLDTIINVLRTGSGSVTIDADTGVTLNGVSSGAGVIQTRFQGVTLWKRSTNVWVASGDIGTVS